MARRKSFPRQIMEAGFGEMLQDYGFEKISTTHYRRSTQRVVWDQVLNAHPLSKPEPRTFRDILAVTYGGFEEVYARFVDRVSKLELQRANWQEYSFLRKISGHDLFRHSDMCIISNMVRVDPKPLVYWDPQPPKGFFKALLWLPPKPPKFADRHPDVINGDSYHYWKVREERDIQEFTSELCDYWQNATWPEIQLEETPGSIARGSRKNLTGGGIDVRKLILLWMDGYDDLVFQKIEEVKTQANETYESVQLRTIERGTFNHPVYRKAKSRDKLTHLILDKSHDNAQAAIALEKTFTEWVYQTGKKPWSPEA